MRIRLEGGQFDGRTSWVPGIPHSVQVPAVSLWGRVGQERQATYERSRIDLTDRCIIYSQPPATAPDGASQNHVPPSPGAYEDEQKNDFGDGQKPVVSGGGPE